MYILYLKIHNLACYSFKHTAWKFYFKKQRTYLVGGFDHFIFDFLHEFKPVS